MGSTELAFYSDFRTRRMNNTESVATLDAYLTGCFVYKDTLRTKSWFARTRDDDGVPYYEECKIRPYSTLDNGDLYTYAVYEKVVDKKSKNNDDILGVAGSGAVPAIITVVMAAATIMATAY